MKAKRFDNYCTEEMVGSFEDKQEENLQLLVVLIESFKCTATTVGLNSKQMSQLFKNHRIME